MGLKIKLPKINVPKINVPTPQDIIDKAKEAAKKAEAAIKEAERKRDEAIKKAAEDLKKQAQKVDDKIKQTINNVKLSVQDAAFQVLLPFKTVMKNALARKGIKTDGSLKDIALKFSVYIVDGENTRPTQTNYFNGGPLYISPEDNIIMERNFHADEVEYTEPGSEAAKYEAGAKQTKNIIQKIIQWFKDRKKKKEAGEPLTADELLTLSDAEMVSETLIEDAEEAQNEVFLGMSLTEIIIAAVILSFVLYLIFKPKKGSK